MKKLLRHWIANSQNGLHLALGVFFCAAWILGGLIASTAPESALCGQLRALGYGGLFLTLLAALFHAAVHGCNRFLLHYRETSRLPVRQLTLVCLFSAVLLLIPGAGLMFFASLALPRLAGALAALLLSRRQAPAPADAAEILPGPVSEDPDLSGLLPAAETRAWVRIAEQILLLTGSVLLAALLLFALYRLLTALFYRLTHLAPWDDDVRISIRPGEEKPADDASPREKRPASGRLRDLFSRNADPRVRIRRLYKKTVLDGRARQEKDARKAPFPWSWAAPAELERLSGTDDAALHRAYEKARYSPHPCTEEEAAGLRR